MEQLQTEEQEVSSVNKSSVGGFSRAQKIPSTEKKKKTYKQSMEKFTNS